MKKRYILIMILFLLPATCGPSVSQVNLNSTRTALNATRSDLQNRQLEIYQTQEAQR